MDSQQDTATEQAIIHKHSLFFSQQQQTNDIINSLNFLLNQDPIWLTRCIINLLQQSPSQHLQHLIHTLSQSTDLWLLQISHLDASLKQLLVHGTDHHQSHHTIETLIQLINENQLIAESCSAKWFSIQIKIKWDAYHHIYHSQSHQNQSHSNPLSSLTKKNLQNYQIDDQTHHSAELDPIQHSEEPQTPSFFSFYQSNLDQLALHFASQLELDRLRRLLETGQLKLDLFTIFDSIPLHARPSDPDYGQDLIAILPRPTHHFVKPSDPAQEILAAIFDPDKHQSLLSTSLTDQQLTHWYLSRVEAIDEFTGSIDTAIEIIQHGAALGVTGLESIAEDLSLLSKLIYTLHHSSLELDHWTLKEWRSQSPDEIIQAYLSASTPTTLTKDIHQLVLPYLGVLESRRARASIPGAESTIPDALRTWALKQSNRLSMLEALINASSPALKLHQRLIKSNRDLAQILIACFYTSSSVDQWELMGRMFECMPAFSDHIPSPDEFNSLNYLHELLSNHSGSNLWDAEGTQIVHDALIQLDIGKLSAILDGLDDHLTTAEVLARWNVPVRLGELVIKFHQNKISQQKLATRLARQEGGIEMGSEEEWEILLEAMIELSQPGRALDLLDKDQVTKLFFSGLLTSGKFKLAKSLLSSSDLSATIREELVIAASREFYDNAETADLQTGEMKMAYDCLTVVPQTFNIKREQDFIEASCRLASFKLESQPGILMSPIEFRLKANKLELISQLLEVSRMTYQHPDMIIDLVGKLAYGKDLLVEIKALSMVVDFAIGERDLLAACSTCERMISILARIKQSCLTNSDSNSLVIEEASEATWKMCEKIGKYSGMIKSNNELKGFKTKFLAHAITICPSEQIPRLLLAWKAAEIEEEEETNQYQDLDRSNSISQQSSWHPIELQKSKSEGLFPGSSSSVVNLGLAGGDLASRTIERATSLFPFNHKANTTSTSSLPSKKNSTGQSKPPSDGHSLNSTQLNANFDRERDFSEPLTCLLDSQNDSHRPIRFGVSVDTDKLTTTLSNKFTSGVGWLIGASEEDLKS